MARFRRHRLDVEVAVLQVQDSELGRRLRDTGAVWVLRDVEAEFRPSRTREVEDNVGLLPHRGGAAARMHALAGHERLRVTNVMQDEDAGAPSTVRGDGVPLDPASQPRCWRLRLLTSTP